VSESQASRAAQRAKVYADALAVYSEAPGTVCVTEKHYIDGRHLVSYRMGYCHGYRTPAEHYHNTPRELRLCEAQA
jgi:hypothetical protein